jgi:DNA-binding CsgD family transcriptional regulator
MMRADETVNAAGYEPENPYALTSLERQVVDLLTAGLTGDEVGDLLGIDRRGVALSRAGAMRKYGARNGLHLAHLVEITRRNAQQCGEVVVIEDVPSALTF